MAPGCVHIAAELRSVSVSCSRFHSPSLCRQKFTYDLFMTTEEHLSYVLLEQAFAMPYHSFPLGEGNHPISDPYRREGLTCFEV